MQHRDMVNRKHLLLFGACIALALYTMYLDDGTASPLTPLIFSMAFRPFRNELPWKERPKGLRFAEILRLSITFGLITYILVDRWPWGG
jgi:hypothetical protein